MQPVLSCRLYRLLRPSSVLLPLAVLETLGGLWLLAFGQGPVELAEMTVGDVLVPMGSALLCAAYDCVGCGSGELRNCLPTGRSRAAAYLASLLALALGMLVLCTAFYLTFLVTGALRGFACTLEEILGLMAWCATSSMGMLCAFHAICMTVQRPIPTLLVLGAFLTVTVWIPSRIYLTLQEPPMLEAFAFDPATDVRMAQALVPNPRYPSPQRRAVLLWLLRALPGSGMATNSPTDAGFWAGAAANSVVFSLLGLAAFRRRNLA